MPALEGSGLAAITPSVLTGEQVGARDLSGLKMRRFRFASIATGDTFSSYIHDVVDFAIGGGGIGSANSSTQIVTDGYSPNLPTMPKAIKAIYDDVAGLGEFTFTVTSGPSTNTDLFVWSRN
jgi:hypothetical protein